MTNAWKVSASVVALTAAAGWTGSALANDDVLAKSKDPGNVVMPSITYNGNNYSTLDQINLSNIKRISLSWTLQPRMLRLPSGLMPMAVRRAQGTIAPSWRTFS